MLKIHNLFQLIITVHWCMCRVFKHIFYQALNFLGDMLIRQEDIYLDFDFFFIRFDKMLYLGIPEDKNSKLNVMKALTRRYTYIFFDRII